MLHRLDSQTSAQTALWNLTADHLFPGTSRTTGTVMGRCPRDPWWAG